MLTLIYDLVASLVARFGEQLAITLGVSAAVTALQRLFAGSDTTPSWQLVANDVVTVESQVVDPVFGLSAIATLIAVARDDILAAVGTPQQTGVAVTLPATTPSGGAWLDVSNGGNTVWHAVIGPSGNLAADNLAAAGEYAIKANRYQYAPGSDSPAFFLQQAYVQDDLTKVPLDLPVFVAANILAGDTLLVYLNRDNPGMTWHIDPTISDYPYAVDSGGVFNWSCAFSLDDFAQLQARLFPSVALGAAPVWPGLAGVSLGASVALDVTVTLSVPVDGVIVTITGVPSKQGQFVLGDLISYRNVGALAFVDDNGEAEFPQLLGLQSAVYCPKSMAHGAGLVVRASPGVTGTVTPWTLA